MPILDVEIVARPEEQFSADVASAIADQAGEVFGAAPGSTWVKLRLLEQSHYAENGGGGQDLYPVFVSVLRARWPSPSSLLAEVERLTEAIAQVCDRPAANVHIIYLPEGAGRVAFGGKLTPG